MANWGENLETKNFYNEHVYVYMDFLSTVKYFRTYLSVARIGMTNFYNRRKFRRYQLKYEKTNTLYYVKNISFIPIL